MSDYTGGDSISPTTILAPILSLSIPPSLAHPLSFSHCVLYRLSSQKTKNSIRICLIASCPNVNFGKFDMQLSRLSRLIFYTALCKKSVHMRSEQAEKKRDRAKRCVEDEGGSLNIKEGCVACASSGMGNQAFGTGISVHPPSTYLYRVSPAAPVIRPLSNLRSPPTPFRPVLSFLWSPCCRAPFLSATKFVSPPPPPPSSSLLYPLQEASPAPSHPPRFNQRTALCISVRNADSNLLSFLLRPFISKQLIEPRDILTRRYRFEYKRCARAVSNVVGSARVS